MPVKPSANEEEYFARQEAERRRRLAEERQKQLKTEERERDRSLHFMRCPKCGLPLEEIVFADVRLTSALPARVFGSTRVNSKFFKRRNQAFSADAQRLSIIAVYVEGAINIPSATCNKKGGRNMSFIDLHN